VAATGADLLVSDCPGCVLQLRGGLENRGGKIKVQHIAEAVAEAAKSATWWRNRLVRPPFPGPGEQEVINP
jgi:hypothetical protein